MELKSSILMRSAPSAWVIPAKHARPVGHGRRFAERSGIRVLAFEHPSAALRCLADPAREEAGVALLERRLDLLDAASVLLQRSADRGGVVEVDVDPDARVRSRDPRHVAQRAAGVRERLVSFDARCAGLVRDDVREHVRHVARHRDKPVVGVGIDRDGRRAERGREGVHGAVAGGVGMRDGREEPGCAFEEGGARGSGPRAPRSRRSGGRRRTRRASAARTTEALVEPRSVTVASVVVAE